MPFDRIRQALRSTDDEAVRKAAEDPELHPKTREEAKRIQDEREAKRKEKE